MDWRRFADVVSARIRALFGRRTAETDARDELAFHLAMQTQANIRNGMTPGNAERAARRVLGSSTRIAEELHDLKALPFIEVPWQDLRYAVRMLRKSPGFTATALLTLALGIGANTAIFSVLNAVILRPLEYPKPEQIMKITTTYPGVDEFWVSPPEYFEFRQWTRAFASVGAYNNGEANIAAPNRPLRVRLMAVSDNLLTTLGVNAELGRAWFQGDEARPSGAKVAVLSHDLWQSAFGGDPAMVGRSVEVDGVSRIVIGVMPRGFDVADQRIQIWQPMVVPPNPNRGSHNLYMIGRLANGATLDSARAEMNALLPNWREMVFGVPTAANSSLHSLGEMHRLRIDPLQTRIVGNATTAVWVLQGAVVLVLLVACANLSTLLLSRAESRRKEFAVRSALGAGRRRLLGQAVVEGCLLSGTGAVAGIGIAIVGLRAMMAAYPDSLPRASSVSIDPTVQAFTAGTALLTGLVFGIAPLIHLSPDLSGAALKDAGMRGATSRHALRRGLVSAEVAFAVALVVGAGLLLRTVNNLSRVDAGFNRAHLVTFGVSLPVVKYPTIPARRTFYLRLTEQLSATPGVIKVALASGLPPYREVDSNTMTIEGFEGRENGAWNTIDYFQAVSADYVETMGIPVIEGRDFAPSDAEGGAPVAMVNQTMARAIWPGQSPIGRRLRSCCNPTTRWATIVGVLGDVKQGGVDKKTGTELYFSADRNALPTLNVVVRTGLDSRTLGGTIQRLVRNLDRSLPVIRLQDMDDVFETAIGRPRLIARLLTVFGAMALVLAGIGTYGVLSYMVSERRREIGIRMALGATRPSVLAMVVSQGLRITGAGLAVGIIFTLAIGRLITSLLFGVDAADPLTIAAVVALIGGIALVACYLPALMATRVDPMIALREE
jgi:putative ABC transport system permease protein